MSTLSCILSLVPCCREKSISLVDRITYSQPDSNRYHCAALSKLHQLELDKRCILKYEKRQPYLSTYFKKIFSLHHSRNTQKGDRKFNRMSTRNHDLDLLFCIGPATRKQLSKNYFSPKIHSLICLGFNILVLF